MIELVPERLNDAIVLNLAKNCESPALGGDCRTCSDIGVAVHNWLLVTELPYVIVDLQDEKDICATFLMELIQLRKRLRIPFLFCGVMERPQQILDDYNYTTTAYPVFVTPEEAIEYMGTHHELALRTDSTKVRMGEALQVVRPRLLRLGMEEGQEDADVDD